MSAVDISNTFLKLHFVSFLSFSGKKRARQLLVFHWWMLLSKLTVQNLAWKAPVKNNF